MLDSYMKVVWAVCFGRGLGGTWWRLGVRKIRAVTAMAEVSRCSEPCEDEQKLCSHSASLSHWWWQLSQGAKIPDPRAAQILSRHTKLYHLLTRTDKRDKTEISEVVLKQYNYYIIPLVKRFCDLRVTRIFWYYSVADSNTTFSRNAFRRHYVKYDMILLVNIYKLANWEICLAKSVICFLLFMSHSH